MFVKGTFEEDLLTIMSPHCNFTLLALYLRDRDGSGIFEVYLIIRSTSKKKGGPEGGPTLGLMLKSLQRRQKGGSGPPPPDPHMRDLQPSFKIMYTEVNTAPYIL